MKKVTDTKETVSRATRTPAQVLEQQQADAERDPQANVPSTTAITVPTVPAGDGWDDAAGEAHERVVRGTLLKFADWNWTIGKEAAPIEKGTRLVAVGTAAGWVPWQGGKPGKPLMREPGKRMPEREDLGNLDEAQWEVGPDGKTKKDPWANTRFVYLVDPKTAEAFTFSTSSWGGREAVTNLGDAIARFRSVYPDAVPIVSLEAAPMQTRFGRKSKPIFKIVGWKSAGGATMEMKELPAPTLAEELDDEITL
jgi:hypothetical protein